MRLAKNSLFVVFLQQRLRINTSTIGQHFFDLQHPQGTALKEKNSSFQQSLISNLPHGCCGLWSKKIPEVQKPFTKCHRSNPLPKRYIHLTAGTWKYFQKENRETSTQTTNSWGSKCESWLRDTQGVFFAMESFSRSYGKCTKMTMGFHRRPGDSGDADEKLFDCTGGVIQRQSKPGFLWIRTQSWYIEKSASWVSYKCYIHIWFIYNICVYVQWFICRTICILATYTTTTTWKN